MDHNKARIDRRQFIGGAALTAFGEEVIKKYRAIETQAMEAAKAQLRDLETSLRARGQSPYLVNLDPAVLHLPFGPNVDSCKDKDIAAPVCNGGLADPKAVAMSADDAAAPANQSGRSWASRHTPIPMISARAANVS